MRELNLNFNHDNFNLLWISLSARERELLNTIEEHGDDSEEGALALNDLAYLRLYIAELKEKAEKVFDESVFNTSDDAFEF